MSKRRWFTEAECARAKRLRDGGYTLQEIADRLGSNKSTIGKLSRRGFRRHTFGGKPCPGDLSLRAAELTFNECKAFYHVGAPTLRGWLDEKGIVLPNRQRRAPKRLPPADFAEIAPTMTHRELQRHYHATSYVIVRWKKECGVPTPRSDAVELRRRAATPKRIDWAERYYAERIAA